MKTVVLAPGEVRQIPDHPIVGPLIAKYDFEAA